MMRILTMGGSETGYGHIARMIPVYDAFVSAGQRAEFLIDGDAAVFEILENRKAALREWQHGELLLQTDDIVLIDTLEVPIGNIDRFHEQTKNVYFISDDCKTGKPCGCKSAIDHSRPYPACRPRLSQCRQSAVRRKNSPKRVRWAAGAKR